MGDQEFSLHYPLFALKRASGAYVAYDMGAARPPGAGFGIPVFTTPGNLERFRSHSATDAEVVTFDGPGAFRTFLRPLRDRGTVILFDLLPDEHGGLHAERACPAAFVLERLLPEPGFVWGYPVYVLKYRSGFACVRAEHEGTAGKWLAVFTDADLADRAVAAATESLEAMPVGDGVAFAGLVRGLAADVVGVLFDPPDASRGARQASGMLRAQLLASLAREI